MRSKDVEMILKIPGIDPVGLLRIHEFVDSSQACAIVHSERLAFRSGEGLTNRMRMIEIKGDPKWDPIYRTYTVTLGIRLRTEMWLRERQGGELRKGGCYHTSTDILIAFYEQTNLSRPKGSIET